ncbi:MAG: UDP-glucose 4-epimerase GalE [Micrococcales bacterium]|nr:UDP-glucose 4-epimerase GalE [Micrococcales bacterium]
MSICVTGGAGYIGAHIVRSLLAAGQEVVVVDDLSTGAAGRVGQANLVELDLSDTSEIPRLTAALSNCTAVIHIAAKKQVAESVARPAWYYQQNVGAMANLLLAMETQGVDRLVFSSSAACYGQPGVERVTEDTPTQPINPYGATKVVGEELGQAAAKAWGLRAVNLRYFNVAGSGWDDLGDPAVLNLIPIIFERIQQGQPPIVFGDDYPTPDGSCIRDYIHVMDIASAHTQALDYLEQDNRPFDVFNVGTGQGTSVFEVIDQAEAAVKEPMNPQVTARRPGDPAALVGDVTRINQVFGWQASYDLKGMVDSAWRAWQIAH